MPSMIASAIGASAVGGIASAGIGASAASSAAQAQSQAAMQASANQMAMFHEQEAKLDPFLKAGTGALGQLQGLLPGLIKPFQPTMQQLEQTPGYQFSLQQGLQATQNGYAAQGLGQSGAALKGAANYAQGLASTTYQQQFQNYMAQNQQAYNMLGGLVQTGLSAGTMTANMGMQSQSQANQYMTSAAAANAAGMIGSANAINSGIGSVTGSIGNLAMYQMMQNGGFFS